MTLGVATSAAHGQPSVDKPGILKQLVEAVPGNLSITAGALATRNSAETSELAIDLLVYRWIAGTTQLNEDTTTRRRTTSTASVRSVDPTILRRPSQMPLDVRSLDTIVAALAKALDDPAVNWALRQFSNQNGALIPAALPPESDERTRLLSELRLEYSSASNSTNSSPTLAVKSLSRAMQIAHDLRLNVSEAMILRHLADRYRGMHRYRQSAKLYSSAVDTLAPYGFEESCAVAYSRFGALSNDAGKYADAARNCEQAARYFDSLARANPDRPDFHRRAARNLMRAGRAQLALGSAGASEGIGLMKRALERYRIYAVAARSYVDLIWNLFEVSVAYRDRGETEDSLRLLESAKAACEKEGNLLLKAELYKQLGLTYTAARNELNAREAARKREDFLNRAATIGAADLAKLRKSPPPTGKDRDEFLNGAERGAEARSQLQQHARSAEMWAEIAEHYKRLAIMGKQVQALTSLASAQDLAGKQNESLAAWLQAVITARKANDYALAAQVGAGMVDAVRAAGNLNNALETFMDLTPIFVAAGDVFSAASLRKARGEMLAADGQYLEAIKDFEAARDKFLNEVDDPWEYGEASLGLQKAYRSANRPDDARRALQTALVEIENRYDSESLDPNTDNEHSRLIMELYQQLTVAYVYGEDDAAAEKLIEQARRYAWVADLVRQLRASDDPAVSKFAQAVDLLNGTDPASNNANVPLSAAPLAETWAGFWRECLMLKQRHPSTFSSLPIRPLEDLFAQRNVLPADAVVIEYMPTASSTYVFIAGSDKSIIRRTDLTMRETQSLVADLRRQIKELEQDLSAGIPIPKITDWQAPAFAACGKTLAALYAHLLKPIESDFAGKRLLIFALPDELVGLPMHALVSAETGPNPAFLINDYEVSYLGPGMLDGVTSKQSRKIDMSSDRLAIFADPRDNLPGARLEASAIEKVYTNSRTYIGKDATPDSLRNEAHGSAILHIAAHHDIDPNPAGFALRLAPGGESDGRMGMAELSEMNNPDLGLVVLSACDSVSSSDPISSGPSRAAEVFSLAGAQSVLGGLWKVPDTAAAEIMVDFYRGLAKGRSRTESLRAAQLRAIEAGEFAHPFFWACFAMYGNPR